MTTNSAPKDWGQSLVSKAQETFTHYFPNFGRRLWGVPPLPLPTPYEEQGTSGTAVWGGFIQVKETSGKWVGHNKYRTASELAVNTSVVAAGLHYFLNLIANARWVAKANPRFAGDPEAEEYAKFLTEVIYDMATPWPNVVRQAGMFRFHGFSIQEWIAAKRWDGAIGLEAIEVRPQHTIEQWAIDERGSVIGCYQRSPQTNKLLGLPRNKLVYLVEDTITDSPEGLGVFRHLLEPYQRLLRYQVLETRAYERDLRGIPIGRAPLAAINAAVKANQITAQQANQLIAGVQAMISMQVKQSDTGLLLDSQPYFSTTQGGPQVSDVKQWSFELLNGPGLGLVEIAAAIERLQREMARIMGVEHLLLGDGGGSRAVAQDKSRNVYLIASAVLKSVVAGMNKDIVPIIWDLNALPREKMPVLSAEDIAPRDVVEVATTLARMSQAGAVLDPSDPVVNDIRDLLGVARQKMIGPDPMDAGLSDGPQPGEIPLPLADENGNPIPPQNDPRVANGDPNTPAPMLLPHQLRLKDKAEAQRLPRNTVANTDPSPNPRYAPKQPHSDYIREHWEQFAGDGTRVIKRWPFYTKAGKPMYLNGDARFR